MFDMLDEFAAFFTTLSSVAASFVLILFGLYLKTLFQPDSKDFRQLKRRLGDDSSSFEGLYQSFLGQALAFTDRFFEGGDLKENNPPNPHPWSWRTYRRCMGLAIVYPLVFAMLTWGVAGDAGPMGAQFGLTESIVGWQRGIACGGLIAMISGLVMFVFAEKREKIRTARIGLVFAALGVMAVLGVGTAKTDGPFSLFQVACVLTLRWALAMALTFAVSGAVLFIVMSASPFGRWSLKGLQALQMFFGQFFGLP